MQVEIVQIVEALRQGQVVVFPTETVYALAADATNANAIAHLYQLKKRDENKPLAIICSSQSMVEKAAEVTPPLKRVMARFTPGALTCVLTRHAQSNLAENLVLKEQTIGVRLPDHSLALAIIEALGCPLAATSVNLSGEAAATTEAQVRAFCGDAIPYMLPEHASQQPRGRSSTVINFTTDAPKLLREGEISFEEVMACYQA